MSTQTLVEEALRKSITDATEVLCRDMGGGHIEIRIVSPVFEDLNRLKKQRLVLSAIKDLMDIQTGVVHAVDKIEALTPDEAA